MTRKLMPGPYVQLNDIDNEGSPLNESLGKDADHPFRLIPAIEYWDELHTCLDLRDAMLAGDIKKVTITTTHPADDDKTVTAEATFVYDPEVIHRRLDEIDEWKERKISESLQGLQGLIDQLGKPGGFNEN